MALFRKNKKPTEKPAVKRDDRKATPWFERARAVADARNYDYAIECYLTGLAFDPGNRPIHEDLREVALKRKVGGGKPAGIKERLTSSGGDAIDKFLQSEKLWSKDPLNLSLMLQTMKLAVEADRTEPDYAINEVAYWIGNMALESTQTSKKPDKAAYIELRDMLAAIEAYDKAVLACRIAIQLDPDDADLINELKNLEAENTLQQGRYTEEGADFRDSVRAMDKQRELAQEDAITKTDADIEQILERRRAEHEAAPDDLTALQKYVDALLQQGSEENETRAIKLLDGAHERTNEYRFKVAIGDIKMRQMARALRRLRAAVAKDPEDPDRRDKYESLYRIKMKFELEEYTERVANYPTDLSLKFQLGVRLFAFKKFDDAIGAFQQAKSDPKHRASAHDYLGRCYLARGWFDEAVDTFRQGIEMHPMADDKLGMELRYQLMTALANAAERGKSLEQAREAQKIASQLLQTDINFRDIRERIDAIRGLVEGLQAAG